MVRAVDFVKSKLRFYKSSKLRFAIDLEINGQPEGIFQYDDSNGRSIVEIVEPELRGQGYGKILIMAGILKASELGMGYTEDESTTGDFDNAFNSLAEQNYVVNDENNVWWATDLGVKWLNKEKQRKGIQ